MKRTNKKGFTIVELVIVIAVIAILAGVLIPTFTSIIKKANLSNDKSFVRNANIALTAEVLPDDKFDTAGEAIDALNANGFVGKFNAYSSDFHYCYSLENNKLYLVDDNSQVVYPEENVAVGSLWGLYMDQRTSATTGVYKYVAMQNITNSAHFAEVFASGNYEIDLNGHYIKVDGDYSNVTADNGLVIGGVEQGENASSDYTLEESDFSEFVHNIDLKDIGYYDTTTETLTISKMIFANGIHVDTDDFNVVFDDCVFYDRLQFDDASGSTRTGVVKNSKFYVSGNSWSIVSFRSIEIEKCEFNGSTTRGDVQIHEDSSDMTVKITNCTFNGAESTNYPIIRFVGKYVDNTNIDARLTSIEVSNCNFNSNRPVLGFSGTGSILYNYAGTGVTVTFANISIADSIANYVIDAGDDCTLQTLLTAAKA